jgi:hypothetical protein
MEVGTTCPGSTLKSSTARNREMRDDNKEHSPFKTLEFRVGLVVLALSGGVTAVPHFDVACGIQPLKLVFDLHDLRSCSASGRTQYRYCRFDVPSRVSVRLDYAETNVWLILVALIT